MSVRTLGERLGCSKSTASRVLIELEDVGFIDTIKLGSFSRKQHRASEYRLTWLRCDLTGNLPTKKFMQYFPLFHEKDRTVSSEGQKTPARPQQDDCQLGNTPAYGLATSVPHVGMGDAGMGDDRPCSTTPTLPDPGPDTVPRLSVVGVGDVEMGAVEMGDGRPCGITPLLPEIYPAPNTALQLHQEGMGDAEMGNEVMGDDRPCWTMTTLPDPDPDVVAPLTQGAERQSGSITEDENRMEQAVSVNEAGYAVLAAARKGEEK